MRNPHGVGTWTDPSNGRAVLEQDSITCGHCGRVVWVKPGTGATTYLIVQSDGRMREEPGAGCRLCMKPVCLPCYAKGTCTPFERQLELAERRRITLGTL